jgi:NitT/TauT family transport system permease protein
MLKFKSSFAIFGFVIILILWQLICATGIIHNALLPTPFQVFSSYQELMQKDYLIYNIGYSLKLNFLGYGFATILALLFGFTLGLFSMSNRLFEKPVSAVRYLPLTAMLGLFIAWFGIEDMMKIQFLAFGIFVYLLPTIVQRIKEVDQIHIDTVHTLAATKWQTIKTVQFPSAISHISDDIRVLVAISWTYLIVAELVNKTGGLGALIYTCARQSRVDKVFAILVLFVIIGILQDRLFIFLDKILFKHKYV